ncbi:MAG: hypothetical protein V4671_19565 [Armatimonadota bacterium]
MSVVSKGRSTQAAQAVPVVSDTPIITQKQVELAGKILPIIVVVLTLILLPLTTWYATSKSRDTYIDTLIAERGSRSIETREKLSSLEKTVDSEKTLQAEFRGETRASLRAIEKALDVERQSLPRR